MHPGLKLRRRVLVKAYRRYLEADAALNAASRNMRSWFPSERQPYRSAIGNPGSHIRQLYERRERAVLHLQVARWKLETAKQRIKTKRPTSVGRGILLIRDTY